MSRLALALIISVFCTAFTLQPAFAATAAPAPAAAKGAAVAKEAEPLIPMSTVLQNLKMNGYEIVSKVELDNGIYAIDAMTPQGKSVSILMQGHSGEIMQPKQNPMPRVSLDEAVKRVEGSGYHDLSLVQYNGSKYVVKALDQKNKKVKLKVDGATGEISTSWF